MARPRAAPGLRRLGHARPPPSRRFDSYDNSLVGLQFYQSELTTIGKTLPVYMTDTGWTVAAGAMGSRQELAAWTVQAWDNVWLPSSGIEAVMPFMLQDPAWNDFAWIDAGGQPYPVFDAVRTWRCDQAIPAPCD
jgi:hypothetical protein